MRDVRRLGATLATVLLLVLAWEAWVRIANISASLLPAPTEVVRALWRSRSNLANAASVTLAEGLGGFAIAIAVGVFFGVAVSASKFARHGLFPLLTGAQTLPLISIAPLFLLWFGFELSGKVVIVAVFSMFPIAVNTVRGLEAVPPYYSDVALTCGATPRWTLWHVQLRVAARQIFSGIRIAAAYVFATATTAEYLGARRGLGIWLQNAYNSYQPALIFAATVVIVALTALLIALVNITERCLLGPAEDDAELPEQ